MDGLQVANASQAREATSNHDSDKLYTQSQSYAYTPSTTSSQPLAPGYQQYTQPPPMPDEKTLPQDARYRIPFGLSVIAYTFLVAAIILVICGAGFGGAIGAVAASKGKDCSYASPMCLSLPNHRTPLTRA